MIFWLDSDAAFLVQPNAKIRVVRLYYMSTHPNKIAKGLHPPLDGVIHVVCKIIAHLVTSAKTCGIFISAQEIIPIHHMCEALRHIQPPIPLKTENSTTHGFISNSMKKIRCKTWNMRWNWLRDPRIKRVIAVYWDKDINNHAVYLTKHHPPLYHKMIHSTYL